MKILFYELNEVPWRLVDHYIKQHPKSNLADLLNHSLQLTTVTKDSGELHPWSTWPTVHRGVYNDTHDIRFLNQEIKTSYLPYWRILAQENINVGVFGSLQSWPIPKDENYAFYVPDTFAPDSQTYPKYLSLFQAFNLAQTARDGGSTPKKVPLSLNLLKDLVELTARGITFRSLMTVGNQLLREKLNPLVKARRSIFQSPLAFDFFYQLIQRTRPHFATFFSNHAAGMMHRYWKYTFPEDFGYTLKGKEDELKRDHLTQAMNITDYQIGKLKKFADDYGYVLMIGSSMGQEAIDRGDYVGELRLEEFDKFYKTLGYKKPIKNNLAMQPDFAFSFNKKEDLKDFKACVSELKTVDKKSLFTLKESGLTLNCNLQSSPELVLSGVVMYEGKRIPFRDLGIIIEVRDQGTAYHCPEGIWIVYSKGLKKDQSRTRVESIKVAPTILKMFGIKSPDYMIPAEKTVVDRVRG
ncbi:MAG: hypothetical protein WCG05_01985 [Alphaproteobacteria bacterium]